MERRKDPEEQAGRQRDRRGERRRVRVERQLQQFRDLEWQERADEAERPPGRDQPGRTAENGQEARLGQKLRHQVPSRSAEREPHRHLGRAGGGARQQQVRDVGARDQENDGRDAEEEQERHAHGVMHPALSSPPVLDRQGLGDEAGQGLGAHLRLERRFDVGQDAAVQGRHRGAGLVDGNLRPQAGEQVEPVVPAILEAALVLNRIQPRIHRERHEDPGWHVDRRAAESGRRHAYDGQRLTVDQQHVSEHVARAAQRVLPELVAQDGDRMAADRLVDLRTEQPPQRRHEAQRREVRAGDLHALDDVEAPPPPGSAEHEAAVRRDVREDRLLPLQVAEHRVAEHLVAFAGPVAEVRAGLRPRRFQVDQALRLDDRQRTQQQLAIEGEDRRVGPDAERQRQNRDARDDRRLDEHAHRQPDVGQQSLQLVGEPQAARLPAVVLHALDAAEMDAGAPQRFPPGHAGACQILGVGVEVKSHLLVEGVLEALPPGPGGQE